MKRNDRRKSSSPTPTPGNRRTPLGIRSPSSSASPYHAEDFRSESSIRFALECEKKKSPTDLTVVKEHALADFSGMGTGTSNTNNPTQADTKDSKGSGEGANKLGRLFFKVRHNGEKNTLMVTVVKCVGLPVRDSGAGTSDPYVKLQLLPDKQHKVKTRVLRRTLNPVYDEDFTFYGIAVNQLASLTLHFAVLSFDRYSRDDVIGEVMLPVTAALEETEQITNGNGEQSPATPTSMNPATSPAILSRDIAPRSLKMRSQGRGELLVSLCYQPQASRLTAVILKARNIPRMDITGLADPYVKIYLLHNGQRIAKKKTHVKKRTLNPVFNESFVFDVPAAAEGLENLSLEFLVLDWDRVTKNEVIGRLELGGPKATGSALHHWNEVLYSPRRQIAEWHKLRE
nr:EOG090X05OW [Triops cancriformis]